MNINSTKNEERNMKVFALYFVGTPYKQIAEMMNLTEENVGKIITRNKWVALKRKMNDEVDKNVEQALIETKTKAVQVSSLIMNAISVRVLDKLNKGILDVDMNDYYKAIKSFLLLKTEFGLKSAREDTTVEEEKFLDDVIQKMEPQERAAILDLRQKIEDRKAQNLKTARMAALASD